MIRYEQGDMFATPADIRVNTVNCVGVMGAGLARAFKDKYPAMFKEYAKACKAGQVRPGNPHVWEKNEFGESLTIVNLPTKDHWRQPSEYEFIEKDLRWLREFLTKRGKVRIVVPALGCGHGGLDWDRVRPMMEQALDGLEAEIHIFGPSASHEAGQRVDEQEFAQFETLGILRLRPGDPRYPEGLRGKSDATVYVKGDPGVLKELMVAVVPSIKPADREIQGLVACVKEIASPTVHILAGYSPQADRAVLRTALEQGAHVIICLVEGILEFKVRKDLEDVWDEERVTVISGAKPTDKWFPGGVGKATALKLALSKAALVSDPDPEWLRSFSRNGTDRVRSHLFYLYYGSLRDDTAALLQQLQAKAIGRNRQTGRPDVASLLALVEPVMPEVHVAPVAMVAEERDAYTAEARADEPVIAGSGAVFPRRLIEVDLPIRRISAHARREKSIRHGHISTLHIWWARRPLAACRAVICAALWPDPGKGCPVAFLNKAKSEMLEWTSHERQQLMSEESRQRFEKARKTPVLFDDPAELRGALLDFIADFANWDNATTQEFLNTSRMLTQAAHEAVGGEPGTRPLIVDPFAGGGAIPVEALRVGADAFASDLNPIPVLLNKVVLEYIPKYGLHLAKEVRKWGEWIKQEAAKELATFYPKDSDGATPIAYLWARTVRCEGPGCGADIPLIRSQWIAKTPHRSTALHILPNSEAKRVDFQLIVKHRGIWVEQDDPQSKIVNPKFDGTVRRGAATCPCCGFTTPVARVRDQFKVRHGGTNDARLLCVVTIRINEQGRFYRLPKETDFESVREASAEVVRREKLHKGSLSLIPDELISQNELRRISIPLYGMTLWGDVFSNRQGLLLQTLARLGCEAGKRADPSMKNVMTVLFALALGRQADACSSLARWHTTGEKNTGAFGRQALGMVWDFCEINPFSGSTGGWEGVVQWIAKVCESQAEGDGHNSGQVQRASATAHPLADDIAAAWITDPPYYDAVPYAHLSDYFYVWMRRMLHESQPELFGFQCVPKEEEVVVDRPHSLSQSNKDVAFYERELTKAFAEGRRVLRPEGIGAIVFASKTTASWEAILKAVVDSGWIITGSWPIDTEMEARVAAQGQARLASSVHLVCRPRESADGRPIEVTGDWRDVMSELPKRIGAWLPRLSAEGVVGADAIFACIGPALEIFSRYSAVEKTSGERVELREYLEQVWAEVARQALNMIFEGADATGFEEDARLTAMWLWTLRTDTGVDGGTSEDSEPDESEESPSKKGKAPDGYLLEYDAARKIAQGLGCHLENMKYLVEVGGESATLLSVGARARYLFGREDLDVPKKRGKKKDSGQGDLFEALALPTDHEIEREKAELARPSVGKTVLDQLHQAMILFGTSRGQALKRFLVDDGVGGNAQLWKLAQALSALYPATSDEKRWVDGVLARKKGLGF